MVAGDLVNTASHPVIADPGSVRRRGHGAPPSRPSRTTAGSFALKGKEERSSGARFASSPRRRAAQVAGPRGSRSWGATVSSARSADLFHVCAEEGRAPVSVTGIAGIGKPRLVWEFYKYFDGLTQITTGTADASRLRRRRHVPGARTVRMRCGIAGDDRRRSRRSRRRHSTASPRQRRAVVRRPAARTAARPRRARDPRPAGLSPPGASSSSAETYRSSGVRGYAVGRRRTDCEYPLRGRGTT